GHERGDARRAVGGGPPARGAPHRRAVRRAAIARRRRGDGAPRGLGRGRGLPPGVRAGGAGAGAADRAGRHRRGARHDGRVGGDARGGRRDGWGAGARKARPREGGRLFHRAGRPARRDRVRGEARLRGGAARLFPRGLPRRGRRRPERRAGRDRRRPRRGAEDPPLRSAARELPFEPQGLMSLRVAFMGSPEFAGPPLGAVPAPHDVAVVVTQPDKPAGRGRHVEPPPVKLVAERAGVPVLQPRSARAPELVDALRRFAPDVAVVVAYGKILPQAVLDVPRHGCLNVHASLLPRYRGAAPIQWAIIRGETETGITIMKLDAGMDTGPMLLRRAVAIAEEDTAGTLAARLAPLGAELMREALVRLEAGAQGAAPPDGAGATPAPLLKKEDGRIDWTRPARAARDLVRGVDPWPGATAQL